jgi:glyoxylase-like metal-dependent hydrolase (beta-lactamase superfamily II)
MRMLRGVVTGGLLALAVAAAAQEGTETVEVKATSVAGAVWMLEGRGGNIAVSAGEDGILMVDDQYAPLTPAIGEAIARIQEGPVRFVLNTHWHRDHTGGNENFGAAGAIIVAHDNVRTRMSTEQFIEFFRRTVPPSPDGALPVITFGTDVSFHLNGEAVRAFHVPHAHTDGDAIVHFPGSGVVHMGDVFFNGTYPFIDVASGGSVRGVITAVERVLPLLDEETHVIPGHGPLAGRAELVAYRDLLATVVGRIDAAVADGKSLDEVLAAAPTADFDAQWGDGSIDPSTWVRMLYADLSREATGARRRD